MPWLGSFKSSIDDWEIVLNEALDKEESVADVFTKYSDERVSILVEGGPSKGSVRKFFERKGKNCIFYFSRKDKCSSTNLS